MEQLFQHHTLRGQSFMQKILRQLPQENALIELNNLLASKQLSAISAAEIMAIEQHYAVELTKEFPLNLQEFYAVALNAYLLDSQLSEAQRLNLSHLQNILGLHGQTVDFLHHEIGKTVYRRELTRAVSDGRLTEEENRQMDHLQQQLNLSDNDTGTISTEVRKEYFQGYFSKMIADQRISPAEEKEFYDMAKSLNISPNINKDTAQLIERLKRYWELEHLPLPAISADIEIQKSETCHLKITGVDYYEPRSTRSSYGGTYEKLVDTGNLYLTQKRLIHYGGEKNHITRLENIIKVTRHSDGLTLHRTTGKDPTLKITTTGIEELHIILNRLLHR